MSARIPIAEAKARFAEVVRRAERGESIVLTRHGRPVARLGGAAAAPRPYASGPDADAARADSAGDQVRERTPVYDETPATPAAAESRREALERLLEEEVWPRVPGELLGRGLDKREREEILGLDGGPEGGGL